MKQKHTHLNDETLLLETARASQNEKAATFALLEFLSEVDRRKAYAIRAYSSLFDYIVKELKYSESQAAERVNAVRLMRTTPEAKTHLKEGALNLTTAAQIQRFVQNEKKLGEPLQDNQKFLLIEQCLNQPKREVEKILFKAASEPVKLAMTEKIRTVSEEHVEIKVTFNKSAEEKLKRARELVRTDGTADLLERALDALIEKEEKKLGKVLVQKKQRIHSAVQHDSFTSLGNPPTPPAVQPLKSTNHKKTRYIPHEFKRIICSRSNGQCEFIDSTTKKRCESRAHLEVDHVVPLAKNGSTSLSNLRHLCRNHNARSAVEWGLVKPG